MEQDNYMTTKKQLLRIGVMTAIVMVVFFGGREIYYARHITRQSLMIKMSGEDLAKQSSMIIQGTVVKSLGTKRFIDENGEIMVDTRWQIKTDKSIKGQNQGTIIVQTPGGRYGLTEVIVEDAAELVPGGKVLLYLHPYSEKGEYSVTGQFQGKFEEAKDSTGQEVFKQQGTNEITNSSKIAEEMSATQL